MLISLIFLHLDADVEKMQAVKDAFKFAWDGYKKCAYGHDFLMPKTCNASHWLNGTITLIDSLDTLYLMGFHDELDQAIEYLETNYTNQASGSVFELIIRNVGGLVSAYELTSRPILLDLAINFTKSLLKAFDTPTGLPMPNIDTRSGKASTWGYAPRSTFLAHAGSLAPEFMALSELSGDDTFKNVSDTIMKFFFDQQRFHGLWPHRIDYSTGVFGDIDIGFDAYGDSFYEYLLKLYLLTNKKCVSCGTLYSMSIQGMKDFLTRHTAEGIYVGTIQHGLIDDTITHLSYFIPGMLALGSSYINQDDLDYAIDITKTYEKWYSTKSNLSPESFSLKTYPMKIIDPSYKLRPEFIESLFYLYRFTGENHYREKGWEIFQSIVKYCKTEYGFGTLIDVENPEKGVEDIQDSFLLSETFKYAYLLFADSDTVNLDKFVFTTEGHILRKFNEKWIDEKYKNEQWFYDLDEVVKPFKSVEL
ncbi:Glycosyl hydrolase family 47 protein [Trichomonas vaginalis G3]|uniref:alpha-1,2-Mannosidase n=1 Tax=Trichomonas vaginalis (strain ATCC PRA-98 / G3) TaxID=412133 RepID=A2F433_TRIV3|nr:glycosyl hydrolase [Trichomonas vaginalis G3]EAY00334.1 Glycosyl hydrolase family 47 protein [Trichomonas vaginalis G3]KAI5508379.1 mannosyl-oligosaccharide 1,2-alpha-mannosidase protein [Trichomonas vaginalis G3]|eukprot:XP_001313263.1 glycosyl hydrolase [Trichomonas vaginalis G3]